MGWGGGPKKGTKSIAFWEFRGLGIGAILQNFISLSIQGVRSSFFVQIKAEVKGISHKKLISKSDFLEGMLLVSKSRVKSQNSRTLALKARYRCQGWGGVQFFRS